MVLDTLSGRSPRYRLWEVYENAAEVARLRELAGCFVLLSNVPIEGDGAMDGAGLLKTYKGQYGVESDFAFLKDPLIVNDIFLKTPSRIDALGMVLIIALCEAFDYVKWRPATSRFPRVLAFYAGDHFT